MDKSGGDETRHYETKEQGREHERRNYETEERSQYDRNQQRHEGRESDKSKHRIHQKGEGKREHERGHDDSGLEGSERGNTLCRDPHTTKRQPPPRDIRHVNYAFSGPHEVLAEKEAQEWLQNLSVAGGEEENDPFKIWPKEFDLNNAPLRVTLNQGQKYRTGTTNASPQMQERLQRCEQDQERHEYKKHIPRLEKRNESPAIYPVLHVEENQRKSERAAPLKLWGNTRRSSVGNNSANVYAVMHPGSEDGDYLAKRKPPKVSRNHLKEHRAAIAEMSAMAHFYRQKECEEEARRLAAVKVWDGGNLQKKRAPKPVLDCRDFMERNMEAITEQSQYAREVRENPQPDYSFMNHKGKVPKFLRQRKRELLEQAEERDREQMTQAIPEGRKMMSETERLQTLENLEQKHKQLIRILKSFPLVFDTAHQIRMKSEIEHELKDIEASHSYYNNHKVYLAEPQPNSTARGPLSVQKTNHSHFPHVDNPSNIHAPDGDQSRVSSSTRAHVIPMTYSNSSCDTCFAPLQRVIKGPESRKSLRCTACTLKLKTKGRSLWALRKKVEQRTTHFSR